MNKGRLEAFADGVFAIVITLLVLEIKVPGHAKDIIASLTEMYPHFVSYFMSFIVVGIYWVSHHLMMHHVKHTTRTFLWINLFFILCVSTIPFWAALLGEYSKDPDVITLFCIMQVVSGIASMAVWWYATKYIIKPGEISEDIIGIVWIRNLITPTLYGLAIPMAYYNTLYAFIIFFSVPLVHILPTIMDMKWFKRNFKKVVEKW